MRSSTLTLAWDPPVPGFSPESPSLYRVYCKRYGEGAWRPVAEVPAGADLTCTLFHEDIGNGLWEFAVQSVGADERGSPLHTSLDSTADPLTGWRVLWVDAAR